VDDTTTGGDDDPSDGASSYDDQYYSDSEGEDSYFIEDDSFGVHNDGANTSNYGSSYGSDDDDEDMSTSALDLLPENPESQRRLAIRKKKNKKQKVAALEHQRVFRARILVLFLLATTAIGNAMIIYSLSRNQEIKDYDFHVRTVTCVL